VVKKEVIELKRGFNRIHYCFNEDVEAYKYYKLV